MIHFIAIAFASGITVRTLKARTDAQFLIQRSGYSSTGKAILARMKQREPASIDEYRYILKNGQDGVTGEVALRLSAISNDESDIDLLESAIKKRGPSEYFTGDLRRALEQLKTRLRK